MVDSATGQGEIGVKLGAFGAVRDVHDGSS
jgi:hypothetical protein